MELYLTVASWQVFNGNQKVHSCEVLLGRIGTMARGKLQFLSSDEIRRIHDTSLKVLEEVGIALESDAVTKLLLDSGCTASKDGERVLIPGSVVKSALSKAPKSILLASKDGKHDIRIPDRERLFISTGGEGVYIKDLLTGDTHTPTAEDLAKFEKLTEALPQIDFSWFLVGAQEQPAHLKGFVEMMTGFTHTTKHIQSAAADALQRPLRSRFRARLTAGVRLSTSAWRGGDVLWSGSCPQQTPSQDAEPETGG